MISPEQGELLATFHEKLRPKVSIEVGMAYGYSTLFIADAMFEHGYGFHIAVDAFQRSTWHGIAMATVEDLSFQQRVRLVEDMSASALPRMFDQGVRADYVYIDGQHTFDAVLGDFCASDRLLNVGGLIILDDLWMPSIRKVAAFIRANFTHYAEVPTPVANVFCAMKQGEDRRNWDHFVDFN
jgi:predicted O-methyltransferase YrrM